jgi:DNA-binding response OmpR family regulator
MLTSYGCVLVVDDDSTNRSMLSLFLERKGFTVVTAADGTSALELLAKGGIELILLDIEMPGLNGLDVLEAVRRTWNMSELPIIMATVKDESSDVVAALQLGANDYLTKPFDFPVVLARP